MKETLVNNTMLVKETNVELVRDALRAALLTTRQEIASMTGLSVATCKNVINELIITGEVLEDDLEESSGGRPAKKFRYNKDFLHLACIGIFYDSSVKKIQCIVSNAVGDILENNTKIYDEISYDIIDSIVRDIHQRYRAIKALTISIPGESYDGIIRFCDIKELQGVPLEIMLHEEYDMNVNVEGIAHVLVYGYYKSHPDLQDKTVAVILAPKDLYLGAGIVVNGQLIKGDRHLAGEVSFIANDRTREESLELMKDKDFFMKSLTTATTAIISVVNPSKIIITGGAIQEDISEALYEKCRQIVPKVFMPELEVALNIEEIFISGIISMVLSHTTSHLKIIRSYI